MTANISPSPPTVMRRAVEVMLRRLSTCEPGIIEAYDPDRVTASVQPLLMERRPSETGVAAVRRAVVDHAPVLFLGGGTSRLTFPVERGDECLIIAASKSLDRWATFGGEQDPQDVRRHHITDAFVLVCPKLSPASSSPAHATATVLTSDDLRLGDDTAELLSLKSDLAGFISIFDGWTPVATDGGAALKLAYTTYKSTHPGWPFGTTKVKGK